LAAIVIIGDSIVVGIIPRMLESFRFQQLPPVQDNWTNEPVFIANRTVPGAKYEGFSVIESFGLVLGGYDVERDREVFERQLRYFFGPAVDPFGKCSPDIRRHHCNVKS
jgi:hypothetical protein